jgi:hypothetical protein
MFVYQYKDMEMYYVLLVIGDGKRLKTSTLLKKTRL